MCYSGLGHTLVSRILIPNKILTIFLQSYTTILNLTMYSCYEITTYITFSGKFLKFLQLFYKNVDILQYLSMSIRKINDIVGNLKKSFSLGHLVGL